MILSFSCAKILLSDAINKSGNRLFYLYLYLMQKAPTKQQYEDYYYNAPATIELKNDCPECGNKLFISPYCSSIGSAMLEWNVECTNDDCSYEDMCGLPDLSSLQNEGFIIDDTIENGEIMPEYWDVSEWPHKR